MAEKGFNDLELLSQEELLKGALQHILDSAAELSRRAEVTRALLKSLCDYSLQTRVWYILFESGGTQRFTDILGSVGCSRAKLSEILLELLMAGLVRKVESRYQAVSPAWLVHFSEPNRRKI